MKISSNKILITHIISLCGLIVTLATIIFYGGKLVAKIENMEYQLSYFDLPSMREDISILKGQVKACQNCSSNLPQ